jgi:hypothetical protein
MLDFTGRETVMTKRPRPKLHTRLRSCYSEIAVGEHRRLYGDLLLEAADAIEYAQRDREIHMHKIAKLKRKGTSRLTRAENSIIASALRMHYWFMQPIDKDRERNGPNYRKAVARVIRAAERVRRERELKRPSVRTALVRME